MTCTISGASPTAVIYFDKPPAQGGTTAAKAFMAAMAKLDGIQFDKVALSETTRPVANTRLQATLDPASSSRDLETDFYVDPRYRQVLADCGVNEIHLESLPGRPTSCQLKIGPNGQARHFGA